MVIKLSGIYLLKEYYVQFLKKIRNNSISTIGHYLSALDVISLYLVEKGQIKSSLYEVSDIVSLQTIREDLYQDPVFVDKDERGHRMYSAALNNYFRFASGETFLAIQNKMMVMDIAIPVTDKSIQIIDTSKRSSIIKNQVIMSSGYKCEINENHNTFTSDSTRHPYMEGHHGIPISKQDNFDYSLDIYANIISLCPICHRLLHYGIHDERVDVLKRIYYLRSDRLCKSGLRLSQDEFIDFSL